MLVLEKSKCFSTFKNIYFYNYFLMQFFRWVVKKIFLLFKLKVTDTEMDSMLNQIVDGLFSVCVTLGTVPIIR